MQAGNSRFVVESIHLVDRHTLCDLFAYLHWSSECSLPPVPARKRFGHLSTGVPKLQQTVTPAEKKSKLWFYKGVWVYFTIAVGRTKLYKLLKNAVGVIMTEKVLWLWLSCYQSMNTQLLQQRVKRRSIHVKVPLLFYDVHGVQIMYTSNPQHNTHTCETSNNRVCSTPCEKQTGVLDPAVQRSHYAQLTARGCAGPFYTHSVLLPAFLSPSTRKRVGEGPGLGCVLRRARWK